MGSQENFEGRHGASGISRRGFLRTAGVAAGAVVGSQLLDDMLCFAAESIPADGPTTVKPVVDVVSIWPKGHAKMGRMDWGYGKDTYNYQRNLYKEILEKAAKEIGVKVRFRNPVTTDAEVAGLLESLKKTPPAGLILTGHTLHTWNWNDQLSRGTWWNPFQAIVDGRGDIPTVVFFNLPNIEHHRGPPVRYGKPYTYTCTAPDVSWLETSLRLVSAPQRLKQAKLVYASPKPREVYEVNRIHDVSSNHLLGPGFVNFPDYLAIYHEYEASDEMRQLADFYEKTAKKVIEPEKKAILNAVKHYVVLRDLIRKNNCQGVVVSGSACIGAPGDPGPACVAISRLNDEGFAGTCEGDPDFCVANLVSHMICGRPSVMGNCGHLTATNTMVISHCYSPTKLRGPKDEYRAPFQLRDFHGRPACVPQVFWPEGEKVTFITPLTMRYNREYAVGTGSVVSNIAQPPAFLCRTAVELKVDGLDDWDTHTYRPGQRLRFHSSYVLGDMRERFDAFGQLAGVKISPVVRVKAPGEPGAPILSMNDDKPHFCHCC